MAAHEIFKHQPAYKTGIVILLCYIAAAMAIIAGHKTSPVGPCVPGMGNVIFFLLIPISFLSFIVQIILFIIDIVRKGSHINLSAMFVHQAAFVIILAVLFGNP